MEVDFLTNYPTHDDDDDEEEQTANNRKRPSPSHDRREEEKEPAMYKRFKRTDMFSLDRAFDEDSFTIPEIQRRDLPREDGYALTPQDLRERDSRPFGRGYLDEQAERQRLMMANPRYRFFKALAGHLRKQIFELFDDDDMSRLLQERESQRLEMQLQKKRTIVSVQEKFDSTQRLTVLLGDLKRRYGEARAQQPQLQLRRLTQTLIEQNVATTGRVPSVTKRDTSINQLTQVVAEYSLLTDVREGVDPSDLLRRIMVREETKPKLLAAMQRVGTRARQTLCFFWYIYWRDYLNNESPLLFREMLLGKVAYLQENGIEVGDVEKLTRVASLDSDYTVQGETPTYIDWRLYRETETIDMTFYDPLRLSPTLENAMIRAIPVDVYPSETVQQLADFAMKEVAFNVSDPAVNAKLVALFKIRYPAYDTPLDQQAEEKEDPISTSTLRRVVRSHLLWSYLANTPLDEIVNLFYVEQQRETLSQIATQIKVVTTTSLEALKILLRLYEDVVHHYLTDIASYFDRTARSIVAPLPPTHLLLARDEQEAEHVDETGRSRVLVWPLPSLGVDMQEANAAFRGLASPLELVSDPFFGAFLREGEKAFVSEVRLPIDVSRQATESVMREPVPSDNPALVLHYLFRYYEKYLRDYTDFLGGEIALAQKALDKARDQMAVLLGDEQSLPSARVERPFYAQHKSFTTQPINSGYVQIRDEMMALCRTAYHNVQSFILALRGLKEEDFESPSAWSSGLTDAFLRYCATLYAKNDLLLPEKYNSRSHYGEVTGQLESAWDLLRTGFRYSGSGQHVVVYRRDRPLSLSTFSSSEARFTIGAT